jgi:hypothetical protein
MKDEGIKVWSYVTELNRTMWYRGKKNCYCFGGKPQLFIHELMDMLMDIEIPK